MERKWKPFSITQDITHADTHTHALTHTDTHTHTITHTQTHTHTDGHTSLSTATSTPPRCFKCAPPVSLKRCHHNFPSVPTGYKRELPLNRLTHSKKGGRVCVCLCVCVCVCTCEIGR